MDTPVSHRSLGYMSPGVSQPPPVKSQQVQGGLGAGWPLGSSASTASEAVMHGWPLPHPRALVSLQLSMPLSTRPWQKDSTSLSFLH